MIFLFGLEALFTRDFRVLSCAVSSSPYWLLWRSNPVSMGYHSDQTTFQSSSLYLWAMGKHCFVNMSSSTFCCTVFLYNVFGQHPHTNPQTLYPHTTSHQKLWVLQSNITVYCGYCAVFVIYGRAYTPIVPGIQYVEVTNVCILYVCRCDLEMGESLTVLHAVRTARPAYCTVHVPAPSAF